MNDLEQKQEERSIIAVGKTGSGKSNLLNKIIEKHFFISSSSIDSCATKIECSKRNEIKFRIETHEIYYLLDAYDTPGIGDTKGRSERISKCNSSNYKDNPFEFAHNSS